MMTRHNLVDHRQNFVEKPVLMEVLKPLLSELGFIQYSLFVFSFGNREQNGMSLLTPVSDSVFTALTPFFFLSMAVLRATNTKLSNWLLELFQPVRL